MFLTVLIREKTMTDLPFTLSINCPAFSQRAEFAVCTALLRDLPGKRQIYRGTWNGNGVIVKVFHGGIGAGRRLKKEWHGLTELQRRGVNAPKPLLHGRTSNGQAAMLTEEITDSAVVFDLFCNTDNFNEKTALLLAVVKIVAGQHDKGICQKDLHLGNFLLRNDTVFVLDPARMCFSTTPLAVSKSLGQLAVLACSVSGLNDQALESVLDQYCKYRNWKVTEEIAELFKKMVAGQAARVSTRGRP